MDVLMIPPWLAYLLWILGVFGLIGCLRMAVWLLTRMAVWLEQMDGDDEWPLGPR